MGRDGAGFGVEHFCSMDTLELGGDILQRGGNLRPLVLFIENLLYFKKEKKLTKLKPFLPCRNIDHCNINDTVIF